jgi:ribonuclease HI
MSSSFWWGKSKLAWIRWEKLGRAKADGGMGFRDIEVLNIALLAKQGWRILQHPESMVGTVMKDKYAWRSIIRAREALERGLAWRVGNRESIRVWSDKWLLGSPHFKVQSPVLESDPNMRVCDLIDEVSGWWKVGVIRELLLSSDVEAICNLAISPLWTPGKLVWTGTSNGCFSVRSADHQEMATRAQESGETSRQNELTEVWNHIWKLPTPGVVKLFKWKLCSNALPTKDALYGRHIVLDQLCPMCSLSAETTFHMVWECPASVAVWQECLRHVQKLSVVADDGLGWFIQLWERLSGEDLIQTVTIARLIWLRRNAIIHGREVTCPFQVVRSAEESMTNFKLVASQELRFHNKSRQVVKKWEPPVGGCLKLNWDATLCSTKNMMGVGVVLRDEHGAVVAALASVFPFVRDPVLAEATALWKAVKFCGEVGCQRVVFEGDSLQVVQLVNNAQCWNRYGQLLEDVRTFLAEFHFHVVQHVSLEANKVAHELAKLAIYRSFDSMWIGECPSSIQHFVNADYGSYVS